MRPTLALTAFAGLVLGLAGGAVAADLAAPAPVTVTHPSALVTLQILTPRATTQLTFPSDPATMTHDEAVTATVEAWALAQVPATVDALYVDAGHLARCLTESATWDHHRPAAPRCDEGQRAGAFAAVFGTSGGMSLLISPVTAHN